MLKLLLTKIFPLLLPIAIYLLWLRAARRRAASSGTANPRWQDAPWTLMVASGLLVLVIGMVSLALFTGEEPGGTYVLPQFKDGVVVPGHVER
ncbi:MAG: hypothetical protein CMM50_18580 [Rhodospirillaceae bacterium]|nr:hypothetical protein [Rhodospirillaceae bacterium]